tara:strand:- start:1614 stop:3116 length:1503 start_codon:yes stop_codon:yes gene_type:complete
MPGELTPSTTEGLLVACRKKYGGCWINLPIDAHNIGPWVKINIEGAAAGDDLTVGNLSCPGCDPLHTAIIKSFEYGNSDGLKVKFVVHDTAGGSFDRFAKAMNTDFTQITSDYTAVCRWGWTGVKCNNEVVLVESEPITFLIRSMTTNMSSGKIEYEVEGKDLMMEMMQSRAYITIGDDANPVKLKEAIRRLFASPPQPLISSIKYLRRKSDGSTEPWEFKKEPEGKWESANRNKISIALEWMRPYISDQEKGTLDFTWDAGPITPGVIFWEDLSCKPVECSPLGTYIVNGGGQLSPVVAFQPKFNWNYTQLGRAGGEPGGAVTSGDGEGDRSKDWNNPCKPTAEKGAGVQQGGASFEKEDVTRNTGMTPPDLKETRENVSANTKSRIALPGSNPVEADLVIQGNPTIAATEAWYKTAVAIIVINPFYLTPSSSKTDDCLDWTLKPPCNELASNKGWRVIGVNHAIKEGSYLTTLKVRLDTPGVDKPVGTPLGADGFIIN